MLFNCLDQLQAAGSLCKVYCNENFSTQSAKVLANFAQSCSSEVSIQVVMDLRDYSSSLWSSAVRSPTLAKLFRDSTSIKGACAPKLHSKHEVQELAAHSNEAKKLTRLCQKPPSSRTEQEVSYIQAQVSALVPFFRLWPEALQHELARMLQTEVLVRRESVIARATIPTRVFFVLEGKLNVVVPGSPSPTPGGAAEPQAAPPVHSTDGSGGGAVPGSAGTRVLAVLRRGDACGEAALLGTAVSHADVVVSSQGAVLLALSKTDFLHAFKAILGLRQQDRLLYLRMHPLFAGIKLGDIDLLADALQVSLYPPGTLLLPRRQGEAPRIYLIAEGTAIVRRGGTAGLAARRAAIEEGTRIAMYDGDTVSVLQPLDIIGSALPHGHIVEADTQVKAYWLDTAQMSGLPDRLRMVLESVQGFKSQYFAGRLAGLQALDRARRSASYGSYTYKVGDVVMTAGVGSSPVGPPLASPGPGPLVSPRTPSSPSSTLPLPSSPGGRLGSVPGTAAAAAAAVPIPPGSSAHPGSQMSHLLGTLTLQQVITALDLSPTKDRSTGLPTTYAQETAHRLLGVPPLSPVKRLPALPLAAHGGDATGTLLQQQGHSSTHAQGSSNPAPVFLTELHDVGAVRGTPQGHHHGGGGSPARSTQGTSHRSCTSSPWDHPPSDHLHASHELGSGCALHTMPPGVKAWSKVEHGRPMRNEVHTEVPRAQPVPVTLRSRHLELFERAKVALLTRPPTRDPYGYSDGGDDDEAALCGSEHEGSRQPSRRLSGDMRSRLSRSSSLSAHHLHHISHPPTSHHTHTPQARSSGGPHHSHHHSEYQQQVSSHSHRHSQGAHHSTAYGEDQQHSTQQESAPGVATRRRRPQSAKSKGKQGSQASGAGAAGFDGGQQPPDLPSPPGSSASFSSAAGAQGLPGTGPGRQLGGGGQPVVVSDWWDGTAVGTPFATSSTAHADLAGLPVTHPSTSSSPPFPDLPSPPRINTGTQPDAAYEQGGGVRTDAPQHMYLTSQGSGASSPHRSEPAQAEGQVDLNKTVRRQQQQPQQQLHGTHLRPHHTRAGEGQERWAGDIWEDAEGAPSSSAVPAAQVSSGAGPLPAAVAPGPSRGHAATVSSNTSSTQVSSAANMGVSGGPSGSAASPGTAKAGTLRRPPSPHVKDVAKAGQSLQQEGQVSQQQPKQRGQAQQASSASSGVRSPRKPAPSRLGMAGKSSSGGAAATAGQGLSDRSSSSTAGGSGGDASLPSNGAPVPPLGIEPDPAAAASHPGGGDVSSTTGLPLGVVLPPSVLLGYEMLTPMGWAALMSYASTPGRGGSNQPQEKILPPPRW